MEYTCIKIWISETLDLFFLAQTVDKIIMYKIDLDRIENKSKKEGQIFEVEELL